MKVITVKLPDDLFKELDFFCNEQLALKK